ncbi:MAG: zinc ribbon domain-containing protein [Acidobacteriota bacterium]
MFCPTCAFENNEGVNYCKQCGANLNPVNQKTVSVLGVGTFLAVIAFITICGFAIPLAAMSGLAHDNFDKDGLMLLAFFFVSATVTIDVLLIRLLSRLLGVAKNHQRDLHPLMTRAQKNQNPITSPSLPAPPIAVSSVTEHTTRNFNPVGSRVHQVRDTE